MGMGRDCQAQGLLSQGVPKLKIPGLSQGFIKDLLKNNWHYETQFYR